MPEFPSAQGVKLLFLPRGVIDGGPHTQAMTPHQSMLTVNVAPS